MKKSPCLDCEKRVPACWGKCPDYQEWKAAITPQKRKPDEALEFHVSMVRKAIRKNNRRKS